MHWSSSDVLPSCWIMVPRLLSPFKSVWLCTAQYCAFKLCLHKQDMLRLHCLHFLVKKLYSILKLCPSMTYGLVFQTGLLFMTIPQGLWELDAFSTDNCIFQQRLHPNSQVSVVYSSHGVFDEKKKKPVVQYNKNSDSWAISGRIQLCKPENVGMRGNTNMPF